MSTFTDANGAEWKIDLAAIKRLINGYAYDVAFLRNASLIRTEDHWLQKLDLAADNAQIEFDQNAIRKEKTNIADSTTNQFMCYLALDGQVAAQYLAMLLQMKDANSCARNNLFASAQAINTSNIRWAEKMIGRAKFVRDTSVVALSVIATVASGGSTAFFVAAGGATIGKGAATYQDTGNAQKAVGSGLLQAFSLGVGPAVGSATKAKVALTMVADTTADLGQSVLIEDKKLKDAVYSAMIGLGFNITDKAFGDQIRGFVGRRLNEALELYNLKGSKLLTVTNAPTAFGFTVGADTGTGNRTSNLLVSSFQKGSEDAVKKVVGGGGTDKSTPASGLTCSVINPSNALHKVLSLYMIPSDIAILSGMISPKAPMSIAPRP